MGWYQRRVHGHTLEASSKLPKLKMAKEPSLDHTPSISPMVVLKSLPTRLITMEDSSPMSNTKEKLFTHQNQLRDMVPISILPREKDTDLHHQNTPQPNYLSHHSFKT